MSNRLKWSLPHSRLCSTVQQTVWLRSQKCICPTAPLSLPPQCSTVKGTYVNQINTPSTLQITKASSEPLCQPILPLIMWLAKWLPLRERLWQGSANGPCPWPGKEWANAHGEHSQTTGSKLKSVTKHPKLLHFNWEMQGHTMRVWQVN